MRNGEVRVDRTRLEAMLKLREMSLADLAEKLDMHYNSLLRIRNEETTSMKSLGRLCNALDCHPFDLVVAEGFPEPFLAAPAGP